MELLLLIPRDCGTGGHHCAAKAAPGLGSFPPSLPGALSAALLGTFLTVSPARACSASMGALQNQSCCQAALISFLSLWVSRAAWPLPSVFSC